MRVLWGAIGCIALLLGAIGLVLPLLPTVPFLLLAAWAFGKSSQRLHDWLIGHPTLGPHILQWRQRGAVSKSAKRMASISMLAVLAISYAGGIRWEILVVQAVTLCAVATFLWTRPSH